MPSQATRKKLNAVDWFLILALVLCLATAGARMLLGPDSTSLQKSAQEENYVVSFKISNIRNSSTRYLTEGETFYMLNPAQVFGTVLGNISVTPALYYMVDAEGSYVPVYAPENGDATRIDVTGTMLVSGITTESGFLAGGTTPLTINKNVTLRSPYLYVTITITDIARAS